MARDLPKLPKQREELFLWDIAVEIDYNELAFLVLEVGAEEAGRLVQFGAFYRLFGREQVPLVGLRGVPWVAKRQPLHLLVPRLVTYPRRAKNPTGHVDVPPFLRVLRQ